MFRLFVARVFLWGMGESKLRFYLVGVTYSSEGALGVGHGSLSRLATRGRLTNR